MPTSARRRRSPRPESQAELRAGHFGRTRVDFLFLAQHTVVEFDGKLKYGVPEGADPEEAGLVVWQEKQREDALRDAGYEVVRVVWAELFRFAEVAQRVLVEFGRARARRPAQLEAAARST